MPSFSSIALAAMMASMVSAHGAIIAATGDAGGSGMALGVDTSTPRDGTNRDPFQQDSTRFRGDQEETLGETLGGGDNNLEVGTTAIMAETGDDLPQITPGGEVQMTLHQVNSDGAGPYTCMINADGTATSWTNIPVTTNLEGNRRGRNRDGEAQDFPLVASVPANQECTGTVAGQDNVCLVRCENPARAGPFGGVVPVQMVTAAAEDEEEEEAAAADDEEEAADEEEETAAADEEEEAADEEEETAAADEEEETAAADEEEDEDEAEAEDDEEEEEEDAAKRIRRSHIARFSRI